jgi:hypothetical protein
MREIEFQLPSGYDLRNAEELIERVCAAHGLQPAMKSTLASYPGSVHWHYKRGNEKGTLELTVAPGPRRIWAQVHTNRNGAWIAEVLPRVRQEIEQALTRFLGRLQ